MRNPNPNYVNPPPADPEDDLDHEKFIDHVFDELAARGTRISKWLKAAGFSDVKVRELPLRGVNSWECLMLRGQNDDCRTQDDVQALVAHLAAEMRCQVQPDEFCAVVWGDRVGAHFRLRPHPVQ